MFIKKSIQFYSFLLISLLSLSFCLEESSIILLPFKTKGLQKEPEEDEEEEWPQPYPDENSTDWPYEPDKRVFNASQFINKWFYNGLNIPCTINKKIIESYLNMGNSLLSISKCDLKKTNSPIQGSYCYKPLNSDTYTKKGENKGNDIFTFIGDLHYKTKIQIGEKGNGIDFYFNEKENEEDLCGNFGFNIDTNLDETNLINQLKKRNYINEYIWTLKYLVEDDGIIVLGNKPHFYDNNTYYMSQYCEIKSIPTQSKETAWSFQMDEIRIKNKNSEIFVLSDKKIDLLPDRGLIIGTSDYKKKMDELIFNDLINKKICFSEDTNYIDNEKGINDIYIVYYCDKNKFMGNKYTSKNTYYYSFPSLEFYIKEINMTFTLINDHLFYEIYNRSYFLITFKKSGGDNIWKLGEPFFSRFQFTFDQDKKLVGFYNPSKPKIDNDEYNKKDEQTQNENNDSAYKKKIIIIIIVSIVLVIILGIGAFFLGKKLNEVRKKRANELKDDFEYKASDDINDNNNDNKESENNKKDESLGI